MYFDIILPTIGRPSLFNAIQSVLEQDYQNWFLHVVEDGTPSSFESIKDERITIHTRIGLPQNDYGAWARNYGICQSSSEWVAYLDCDDIYLPNHLTTLVELSKLNPEANMLRTTGQSFSWKHKSPLSSKLVRKLGPINTEDILTVGMCHARNIFNKTQGFQPCDNHDKLLWEEMIQQGGKPAITNQVTFQFER